MGLCSKFLAYVMWPKLTSVDSGIQARPETPWKR
jgi:hypothetical protein